MSLSVTLQEQFLRIHCEENISLAGDQRTSRNEELHAFFFHFVKIGSCALVTSTFDGTIGREEGGGKAPHVIYLGPRWS